MLTKAQAEYRGNLVKDALAKRAAKRPSVALTDPKFVYTSACATDIRKRFDAERARLAALKAAQSNETDKVVAIFDGRRLVEATDERR